MRTSSVLIVDDDSDFVASTRAFLEGQQYKVVTACDQHEGFSKLEGELPGIIILDVRMGRGAEGFIFARKMRKDPRFAPIPILMLTSMREQTGFSMPGEPIHETFLPVDEYIEKPIKLQDLLQRIKEHLSMQPAPTPLPHVEVQ